MAPNPNNYRAEIICAAAGCPSHFAADGWPEDALGAVRGHFHHRMLVPVPPGGRLPVSSCPACKANGLVIEQRRVPRSHRFAMGTVTFAEALATAVDDQAAVELATSGNAEQSAALRRQLKAQIQRALSLHVTAQFIDGEPDDNRVNLGITLAEAPMQRDNPTGRQRIVSAWKLPPALAHLDRYGGLFVITEAGRQATTVMFREEY